MKLFDVILAIGIAITIALAAAGLLRRKVMNVLLLIYTGVLVASSIYYAVDYFHVTTSAPLIVYVAANVVCSAVCLVVLSVVRLVLRRRVK